MKRSIELVVVTMVVLLFGFAMSLPAQQSGPGSPTGVSESNQPNPVHYPSTPGTLVIPPSSMQEAVPAGHKFVAHTNVEFYIPAGITSDEAPPFAGYGFETPASLGCIYGLSGSYPAGCSPYSTTVNPTGAGSQTIAIVDAYDDPAASSDLAWFSLQFGLPLTLTQFQVVWANTAASSCAPPYGVPVDPTGGWEIEESLDIEWSHAMAPKAKIILVEACSNYDTDLQQAVIVANNEIVCGATTCPSGGTGKGEISMSWGGGEFSGENTSDSCASLDDSCFTTANVVYFAASGDSPGVIWPGTSPNVVSAGGLSNRRNATTFAFEGSGAWVDAGGGQSAIETMPTYQDISGVTTNCGTTSWRCVPDVSFDADPYTGVYVYDTYPVYGYVYQWWVVGGTSVSSPALAGIINAAGSFAANTAAELSTIYSNLGTANFKAISAGYCGFYMGFTASGGYNLCGGVGNVKGYSGK